MGVTKVYYNLFLRNWQNEIASELDLKNAMNRGYLTKKDINSIIKTDKLNDSNEKNS